VLIVANTHLYKQEMIHWIGGSFNFFHGRVCRLDLNGLRVWWSVIWETKRFAGKSGSGAVSDDRTVFGKYWNLKI
jgi:hypothetical protein